MQKIVNENWNVIFSIKKKKKKKSERTCHEEPISFSRNSKQDQAFGGRETVPPSIHIRHRPNCKKNALDLYQQYYLYVHIEIGKKQPKFYKNAWYMYSN